jgi:hypothetical protein
MCEDAPCCGCCGDVRENEDYREQYEAELAEQDVERDEDGDNMTDVEADADTLASAGWGTDEDYSCYGGGEDY